MAEDGAKTVKKSFTISELDLAVIKTAVRRCGFLSDSEALRAIIKHFAETAPCLKAPPPEEPKGRIDDVLLKGR
jgi:hypothetical protein